ncbi:MAG: nickel pincer cofactor biosynthesis protein LarC [Actinobacteria bacterium]|nr:nickel pincer cofactor biosynthesis protein LarC [Actinomycetota bacterium]
MKRILYLDCFSGISGDMMVGALIDLGVDLQYIKNKLKNLDIGGYELKSSKVKINAIYATRFQVNVKKSQPPRSYKDIKNLIGSSRLRPAIKELALKIFEKIAEAETRVHNQKIEDVHFHEIGALDSIIDITATAAALDSLKLELIYAREVPLGSGIASTMHGKIPIPAPATVEILKGVPSYGGNFDFEVTTPTGAAIISTICHRFGKMPLMCIEKIGMGAGTRQDVARNTSLGASHGNELPNVLRLFLGTIGEETSNEQNSESNLTLLSTNIDDCTPEVLAYLIEKLLESKAYDAWIEPIYMKKNRPAFKVCALCNYDKVGSIAEVFFSETSTLGIRMQQIGRITLKRGVKTVKLPYGEVKLKVGILKGKEITFSPEFESCAEIARKLKKPLKEVYQDAVFFYRSGNI